MPKVMLETRPVRVNNIFLYRPQLCRPYCRIEKRNAHRAGGVYEAEQQHSASGCGH